MSVFEKRLATVNIRWEQFTWNQELFKYNNNNEIKRLALIASNMISCREYTRFQNLA